MNTTNLFVELVVIGVGAVFSFGLILLTLFGYNWIAWEKITSSVMIIPFLSITYAIGIVVDRLADRLYFNYNKKLRLQVFPDNGDVHFHLARTYVYNYCSDSIFSWFSYLTSRLRISRAWSLNCILLGISIFAFVQIRLDKLSDETQRKIIIISTTFWLFGALASFCTWQELTISHNKKILETYKMLRVAKQSHYRSS